MFNRFAKTLLEGQYRKSSVICKIQRIFQSYIRMLFCCFTKKIWMANYGFNLTHCFNIFLIVYSGWLRQNSTMETNFIKYKHSGVWKYQISWESSLLRKSKYTIKCIKANFKLNCKEKASFCEQTVSCCFTSVLLDETIKMFLRIFYIDKEISTAIHKRLKDLLSLYAKNVPFNFNSKIYTKTDCVAMGSILGPVLDIIFMVELKNTILPCLEHKTKM